MSYTQGLNHLGLAVLDLQKTTWFFTDLLGWQESGYDSSYPRTAVSDGSLRLTLWQVADPVSATAFDRRGNVGLHHLALEIESKEMLHALYQKLSQVPEVEIEFAPEMVGNGPRQHFMCYEPSGIRVEFIWLGE